MLKFDEEGNTLRDSSTLVESNFRDISLYKYDFASKLLRQESFNYSYANKEITKYIYDAGGNLIEETVYFNDDFEIKRIYTYDAKNRLIAINDNDRQNANQKTKYKYDQKNQLVVANAVSHTHDQIILWSLKLFYDYRGFVISSDYEIKQQNSKYPTIYKNKYKYNAVGELIEDVLISDSKNRKTTFLFEDYDRHGNWQKRKTIFNGRVIYLTRRIEYY